MLENIYGHRNLHEILNSVVNIPGSYLFHGPSSVGKRTVAYELSKVILCVDNKKTGCSCKSCVLNISDHPDFKCIGRSGTIRVQDIDDVIEFISYVPFVSGHRIVVIDNADSATWEASNRLLKVIEEPPEGFYFFFVTSKPESLPVTVRYRCIECEFGRLTEEDIINILYKKMGHELPKARLLGWIGASSSTDIFSQASAYLRNRDNVAEFLDVALGGDLLELLNFMDRISWDEYWIFIDMLIMVLTDVIVIKKGMTDIVNADIRELIEKCSSKFKDTSLLFITNTIGQIRRFKKLHVNPELFFKSFIIKNHQMLVA